MGVPLPGWGANLPGQSPLNVPLNIFHPIPPAPRVDSVTRRDRGLLCTVLEAAGEPEAAAAVARVPGNALPLELAKRISTELRGHTQRPPTSLGGLVSDRWHDRNSEYVTVATCLNLIIEPGTRPAAKPGVIANTQPQIDSQADCLAFATIAEKLRCLEHTYVVDSDNERDFLRACLTGQAVRESPAPATLTDAEHGTRSGPLHQSKTDLYTIFNDGTVHAIDPDGQANTESLYRLGQYHRTWFGASLRAARDGVARALTVSDPGQTLKGVAHTWLAPDASLLALQAIDRTASGWDSIAHSPFEIAWQRGSGWVSGIALLWLTKRLIAPAEGSWLRQTMDSGISSIRRNLRRAVRSGRITPHLAHTNGAVIPSARLEASSTKLTPVGTRPRAPVREAVAPIVIAAAAASHARKSYTAEVPRSPAELGLVIEHLVTAADHAAAAAAQDIRDRLADLAAVGITSLTPDAKAKALRDVFDMLQGPLVQEAQTRLHGESQIISLAEQRAWQAYETHVQTLLAKYSSTLAAPASKP